MTYLDRIDTIKTLYNPINESHYDYSSFLSDMNESIANSHHDLNKIASVLLEDAINDIVEHKSIIINNIDDDAREIISDHNECIDKKFEDIISTFYNKIYKEIKFVDEYYNGNKKNILLKDLSSDDRTISVRKNFFNYKETIDKISDGVETETIAAKAIESNKKEIPNIIDYLYKKLDNIKKDLMKKNINDSEAVEKTVKNAIDSVDKFRIFSFNIITYITDLKRIVDLYVVDTSDVDPIKEYEDDIDSKKIEANHIAEVSPVVKEVDKLNTCLESCYNQLLKDAMSIKSTFIEIMNESSVDAVNVADAVNKSIPRTIWESFIKIIRNMINAIKTFWRNVVMASRNHFNTYTKWYNTHKEELNNKISTYKNGSVVVNRYINIPTESINKYRIDNIKSALGKIINNVNTTDTSKMKTQINKVATYSDEDIYRAITKDLTGTKYSNRNEMVDDYKSKYKISSEQGLHVASSDISAAIKNISIAPNTISELNSLLKKGSFEPELERIVNACEKFKRNNDTDNVIAQYYRSIYRVYSIGQKVLNDVYKFKIGLYEKQAYYSFKILKSLL